MSLIEVMELMEKMERKALSQRRDEKKLLESIAGLSSLEVAEKAADLFAAEKHRYSFEGYLHQLSELERALNLGVPANVALEAVDSCVDIGTIVEMGGYNSESGSYQQATIQRNLSCLWGQSVYTQKHCPGNMACTVPGARNLPEVRNVPSPDIQ